MKKHTKIALAFILAFAFAAPLVALPSYIPANSVAPVADNVNQEISNQKCNQLIEILDNLNENDDALAKVKNIGLTKEDLTQNKICLSGLGALVSETKFKDKRKNYFTATDITDVLAEIVGGIDNLRVEFTLNPDGNWFKGSLLAYWVWSDTILPIQNFDYAYYLIGKGASKRDKMQVYQRVLPIENFVRNYGSDQAKELMKVMKN